MTGLPWRPESSSGGAVASPGHDGAPDDGDGEQHDACPLCVAEPKPQGWAVGAQEELEEAAEGEQAEHAPRKIAGALEMGLQGQHCAEYEEGEDDLEQAAILIRQSRVGGSGRRDWSCERRRMRCWRLRSAPRL